MLKITCPPYAVDNKRSLKCAVVTNQVRVCNLHAACRNVQSCFQRIVHYPTIKQHLSLAVSQPRTSTTSFFTCRIGAEEYSSVIKALVGENAF
jgi:hypothetical protein